MNYEGVCRTAPATPSLLITLHRCIVYTILFQVCCSLKEGVFPPSNLTANTVVREETQSWPDSQVGTLYGCKDQQHFSLDLFNPVPCFIAHFKYLIMVPHYTPHRPTNVHDFAEPCSYEVYRIGWAKVLH